MLRPEIGGLRRSIVKFIPISRKNQSVGGVNIVGKMNQAHKNLGGSRLKTQGSRFKALSIIFYP
jgi:hypothetical protein